MELECDVFVFDFDGVIVRDDGSLRPLGVKLLKEALDHGVVYIYSGRPKEDLDVIIDALAEAGGIPRRRLAGILLRRGSLGELEAKRRHLDFIIRREGCIGEVHDDNEAALWLAWEVVAPRALVLHGNDWCRPIKGISVLEPCRGG